MMIGPLKEEDDSRYSVAIFRWLLKQMNYKGEMTWNNKFKNIELKKVEDTDPYNQLGTGVKTYLDSTKALLMMFIILTIVCIPLFIGYGTYTFEH